jgi:hypothetical protein
MVIEKYLLRMQNPAGVIYYGDRPASVVGLMRNNEKEWAYVIPTAAKKISTHKV